MDLARLEAGQEERRIAPFDAAHLLKELSESLRGVAAERNLFLKTEGPESLPVEGDSIKVRRILQNLILNAFKATERGGVRLIWQEHETPGAQQWIVCVQDTGPGLSPEHAAPLEDVLKEATDASQEVESGADLAGEAESPMPPAPSLTSRSEHPSGSEMAGEGIGLAIVKRLCELLNASLELQTSAGTGTTFRIIFPRSYPRAPTSHG
jgi:signal transduction histidine kinase